MEFVDIIVLSYIIFSCCYSGLHSNYGRAFCILHSCPCATWPSIPLICQMLGGAYNRGFASPVGLPGHKIYCYAYGISSGVGYLCSKHRLPEMCPQEQVLGLENPRGQNAIKNQVLGLGLGLGSRVLGLGLVSHFLGLGFEPLALEIKYYHFFFWFKLLSSLFGEWTYEGSNNCGRLTIQCLIHAERT